MTVRAFDWLGRDDLAAHKDAMVLLPLGSTEQHGPGLPSGTDAHHVSAVVDAALPLVPENIDVLRAPLLAYGASHHHLPFGATISLPPETYTRVLLDLGDSLAASGFRRLFMVNGHGGNQDPMWVAAAELSRRGMDVGAGSWWAMAAPELGALFPDVPFPGHAGRFEGSVIAAIREGVVAPAETTGTPLPEVPVTRARHFMAGSWTAMDGFTDQPEPVDVTRGAMAIGVAARVLAHELVRFAAA
jgi:creatinine amidohydrolase